MTRAQECAIARAADHENLLRELASVVERYVMVDDMRSDGSESTALYRTAKVVLAKAKEQTV